MTPLPDLRTKLLGDELLPEHLLKGKRAYEQWATAGGTVAVEEVFPYDDLSDLDRQRWVFFAKAYGDPRHDHSWAVPAPKDVRNYPEAAQITTRPELWDYDEASYPTSVPVPSPRIAEDMFYELWVQGQEARTRKHWWQFRRSVTVDTSRQAYRQELAIYQQQLHPATEPYSEPTIKS